MTITLDGSAGVTFPDAVQQTNAVTNTGGSARYYAARAWVTFDGTVSPPTILAQGNVASVVRSSTGRYTITFASAMPNANYAVTATALGTTGQGVTCVVDGATASTTSAVRIQLSYYGYPAGTAAAYAIDSSRVSVVVFG